MKLLIALLSITAFAVRPAGPQTVVADEWPALTHRLEQAVAAASSTALADVRQELLRLAAAPSITTHEDLLQYAIAYTAWRMAFLSRLPANLRDEALDDAVKRMKAVIKKNPRHAEARALLGGLYAAQIGRSALKGLTLGGRVSDELDRATELDPTNPRAALQAGISAFHTPAVFGGGTGKAERLLRRSLDLFARERIDRPWPNWGRVDAHAWLGQVLVRKGDLAGARSEYDQALAVAPQSSWVRSVLLPALDRHHAER